MTCSGRWEVCVPLNYFRAVKDDKVESSYFNLYFVEGNEFISTQLNPVRCYGYFERYGD
jgi:hypothetical protein